MREVGNPPELDFPPRDHLELAGPRSTWSARARLSGRASHIWRALVMLELALVRWALEKLPATVSNP